MRTYRIAALVLSTIALGCSSATEPLIGPVGVHVTAESVSPGALLPVRLRLQDVGAWYVNPCGYRFERLVDGEWMRPLPVPPTCSEQPNVGVDAGAGTTLQVQVPEEFPPGTYRIAFLVNRGTSFDMGLEDQAVEAIVASNRFRLLALF